MDDLYFITDGKGRVKIGRAKSPCKRLKCLQTGSPDRLELIGALAGRGYEEKVWHRAFCDFRLEGEWFELDDELDWAIALAEQGKPWWDHISPPNNFEMSDDPEEWDDDIVDWQIAVHIAIAGAAEKAGLSTRYAGKGLCIQDNGEEPHYLA